ncbi:MAG: tetratricopeptide repeat protein [Candidatus Sericytochromatia bacterium]|nr:tetratricopeptide repeat protein [Candidatus Sericytochromatia bacterium]
MKETESAQLAQLCFALEGRTEGTLVLIACDSQTTRSRIFQYLQDQFPSQPVYELDLSGEQVESLNRSLRQNLPEQVLSATDPPYLVHVSGLEDSLFISEGGKIQVSTLVAQLNFERETLFRDFPFTTIIWTDPHFLDVLKRQAPDLWSWLVYVYEFESETPAVSESVQPQAYPELVPGLTPERQARIANLESKYAQLNLKEAKERVLREKLNLQKLLGREYAEVHDYEKSIKAYRIAQSLLEQLKDDGSELLEVFFNLGTSHLQSRNYEEALEAYQASLNQQKKLNNSFNYGATYHQLGWVYEGQYKWDDAIHHYQLAIEWMKKTNNESKIGSSYHQIGIVYQLQGKWNQAVQHYLLAIEWMKKTNTEIQIGGTYHQIGMVYEEQDKWDDAIQFYETALKWKIQARDEYRMGDSYHQLGNVFLKQNKYPEAIQHYELAINWYHKTFNQFQLGGTYHQLGLAYQKEHNWDKAIQNYQFALTWYQTVHHEFDLYKSYWSLAEIYLTKAQLEQAHQYCLLALANIQKWPPPNAKKIQKAIEKLVQAIEKTN